MTNLWSNFVSGKFGDQNNVPTANKFLHVVFIFALYEIVTGLGFLDETIKNGTHNLKALNKLISSSF